MKIKTFLLFLAMMFALTSCIKEGETTRVPSAKGRYYTIEKIQFEGHTYLILDGNHRAGICHDENCTCHTLNKNNYEY